MVSLLGLLGGLGLVWIIAPWHHLNLEGLVPYPALIPCLGIVIVVAIAEWLVPSLRVPSADALARRERRGFRLACTQKSRVRSPVRS